MDNIIQFVFEGQPCFGVVLSWIRIQFIKGEDGQCNLKWISTKNYGSERKMTVFYGIESHKNNTVTMHAARSKSYFTKSERTWLYISECSLNQFAAGDNSIPENKEKVVDLSKEQNFRMSRGSDN